MRQQGIEDALDTFGVKEAFAGRLAGKAISGIGNALFRRGGGKARQAAIHAIKNPVPFGKRFIGALPGSMALGGAFGALGAPEGQMGRSVASGMASGSLFGLGGMKGMVASMAAAPVANKAFGVNYG